MRNIIDSIIRVLCTAIMGIMVVAVCWQVITRYVLNNPSTVTAEALRYLLVWTTMVGAAYAYGKRKHLSINILLKKVSAPVQKIVDIGVQCLVIVFCIVVMIMGGLRLCATAADQSSAALGIPMPYIYSCLLVGAVLFIFYVLIFIWEDVKELRIYRGQCAVGCPREKQNPSAHPADASKNENGRNDIS